MSDLIDRQAAIDVIDAVFPVDPMKSEYAQGIACGAALAKTYVEQLPSAQQWIPCSERLPDDGTYLCWEWQGFCYVDSFKNGNWETAEKCYTKCIAWMPLPEPYKEEN